MNNIKTTGSLYLGYMEPAKVFGRRAHIKGWGFYSTSNAYELTYSRDRVDINARHKLLYQNFSFLKGDILSIEPYEIRTFDTKYAIIIKHKIKFYDKYFIFMFSGENTPELLINDIKKSGYFDNDISVVDKNTIDEVRKIQSSSLKPNKFLWGYIFAVILFVILYFVFNWHFLDNFL